MARLRGLLMPPPKEPEANKMPRFCHLFSRKAAMFRARSHKTAQSHAARFLGKS